MPKQTQKNVESSCFKQQEKKSIKKKRQLVKNKNVNAVF
jgi:hypothetical protein